MKRNEIIFFFDLKLKKKKKQKKTKSSGPRRNYRPAGTERN